MNVDIPYDKPFSAHIEVADSKVYQSNSFQEKKAALYRELTTFLFKKYLIGSYEYPMKMFVTCYRFEGAKVKMKSQITNVLLIHNYGCSEKTFSQNSNYRK